MPLSSGGKEILPVSLLSRRDRSDRCHQPVRPDPSTGQTGSINQSDRIHQPVRPVQSSTPDFQTEAFGRGYLEDECTKAAGKVYKSGTYLWAATKQVHKGRSTRSAINKETMFTTASRQCFTSKEGFRQAQR